eukprot:18156_3
MCPLTAMYSCHTVTCVLIFVYYQASSTRWPRGVFLWLNKKKRFLCPEKTTSEDQKRRKSKTPIGSVCVLIYYIVQFLAFNVSCDVSR